METSPAKNPVNRKAIALIFLVFFLGVALGVVGTRLVSARTFADAERGPSLHSGAPAGQQRVMSRMTQDLGLTPDQQRQVSEILLDMQGKYGSVRQQVNPQYEQIRNDGHDRIRQVLTAEQRPKFEAFLQRVQADRQARERGNN